MTALIVLSMTAALGSPVIVLSNVALMTRLPRAGAPLNSVKRISPDTRPRDFRPRLLRQKCLFGNIPFAYHCTGHSAVQLTATGGGRGNLPLRRGIGARLLEPSRS